MAAAIPEGRKQPIAIPDRDSELFLRYHSRGRLSYESVKEAVRAIVDRVRREGDSALIETTKQFDGVDLTTAGGIEVQPDEWEAAVSDADPELMASLMRASHNIRVVHEAQRLAVASHEGAACTPVAGVEVWQTFRPFPRVGCYCPGGRAVYPSSVLMMGVPARVAGVRETILCTPPRPDGRVDSSVLVAAEVANIARVFKVGGAQAIAAMAFGTETIPRVVKLVGPGSAHVAAAKQLCASLAELRIDSPAGPSEVGIFADDSADASHVAADLIAQCEHGEDSVAVLFTTDAALAERVADEMEKQLAPLPRRALAEPAWRDWGAIWIAESASVAITAISELAFEHVELMCAEPRSHLDALDAAGSVFLGHHSPVAVGDYASGTNHVLPTGGWARVYSGLNVRDYGNTLFVQELTATGLAALAPTIESLAKAEGLTGHAAAVTVRVGADEERAPTADA